MKLHLLTKQHLRMNLRYKLVHDHEWSFIKAAAAVWALDDDQLDTYAELAEKTSSAVPLDLQEGEVSSKLGDGQLLQTIIDWFKSPEGQAFLSALFKMLLGLLMGL